MSIHDQLKAHEGVEKYPYTDTVGKLTIGVGRNLTDRGLSDDEVSYLLNNDIKLCEDELDVCMHRWRDLSENRRNVLIDMMFNLGRGRLLGFRKTIAAIESEDFRRAAHEMLSSKWAEQVGRRAVILSRMMGEDLDFETARAVTH